MDLPNGEPRSFYVCTRCSAPATPALPLQRCGGCQLSAYCSRSCQKNDRRSHKILCKSFPVVNGLNVLHTTGSWEEHIKGLREQAALFPEFYQNDYIRPNRIFMDPKVCYTCHESRPELLTMCKCSCVCYCSKKCTRADKQHKRFCSELNERKEEFCWELMRVSYPITVWYVLELLSNEYRPIREHLLTKDITKLKVHVVTNSTYDDAQAWEVLFHHPALKKLNHLKFVFIIQNSACSNPSFNHKGKLNQLECEHCDPNNRKDHTISYSVHRKPYHMFFSSSEYSEPDVVIMYGFTSISNDIHSDISYRNMTYSEDSVLVLTDSTEDLLLHGARAVNAARPIDELVPPILNRGRAFGSHRTESGHDAGATNDKYYLTCLRRK